MLVLFKYIVRFTVTVINSKNRFETIEIQAISSITYNIKLQYFILI
jgi:hypothetical protein